MIKFGTEPASHVSPYKRIAIGSETPEKPVIKIETDVDKAERCALLSEANRIWKLVAQSAQGTNAPTATAEFEGPSDGAIYSAAQKPDPQYCCGIIASYDPTKQLVKITLEDKESEWMPIKTPQKPVIKIETDVTSAPTALRRISMGDTTFNLVSSEASVEYSEGRLYYNVAADG